MRFHFGQNRSSIPRVWLHDYIVAKKRPGYDADANLTLRTSIADSSYPVYEWDHRNRLDSVTDDDASDVKQQQVVYGYDAYNNLISRDLDSNGDGTVDESGYFIYDNGQILLQLDSSGDVEHRMLWGAAVDQIPADENEDAEKMSGLFVPPPAHDACCHG